MFLEDKKQQNLKKLTAIALAVLFLDQVVKLIVIKKIFFEIEIQKNYNALFGLPVDSNLIFIFFVILFLVFMRVGLSSRSLWVDLSPCSNQRFILSKDASESSRPPGKVALALILGGIAGNSADRIFHGYIIDYFNLFNLFIFNLADLAIFLGVLLLSWKILGK